MTKTKTKIGILSAISTTLLLAVIMPSMPFAIADAPTVCGDSPGVEVLSGVYGDVVVPGPGRCAITTGAVVNGDVKQSGGQLEIFQATINGNVHTNSGIYTSLWEATVTGNVHIKSLSHDGFNQLAITGSVIDGNVQIHKNSVDWMVIGFIIPNTIGGNLNIFHNSIDDDFAGAIPTPPATIMSNLIGGNLNCNKNTGDGLPFTNLGSANIVSGDTKHQCDGL